MNKRIIIKSTIDGLTQSLIFACLGFFCISEYASTLSLKQYLMIGVLGAILSAAVYIVLALKETKNKNLVCFSLTSILWFALFTVLLLTIYVTFNIEFLPFHKANNVNGIMILFTQACYILVSFVLRTSCFVIMIIKHKSHKKTEDGSLSC